MVGGLFVYTSCDITVDVNREMMVEESKVGGLLVYISYDITVHVNREMVVEESNRWSGSLFFKTRCRAAALAII